MGHPFVDFVEAITDQLDKAFNPGSRPDSLDKKVGFILIVFPLGPQPEGTNAGAIVSTNGVRKEDVISILRQQSDLFASGQITEEKNSAKPN